MTMQLEKVEHERLVADTTRFNINPHVIAFLQDSPFYAEISRHIPKIVDQKIKTLGVGYIKQGNEIVLFYNPSYMSRLTDPHIRNVLLHEFLHIVFGHLNLRRKKPHSIWNVATDCAINSIIVNQSGRSNGNDIIGTKKQAYLPEPCFIPGHDVKPPDDADELNLKLYKFIAMLEELHSSEFYFNKILEFMKDNECESGSNGEFENIDTFDVHDMWDDIPDCDMQIVEGKIKSIVGKAVVAADTANSWGTVPQQLQREIRRSISTVVDWRAVLRQFAGYLVRGHKRSSMKRINRRYPYVHPGQAKGFSARLIVGVDQSGSVSDELLELFFGELRNLNKKILIDYVPFDSEARIEEVVTWNRGACPNVKRGRCGGTDFDAVTNLVNDEKNRGRWDGLLTMTDGCAPAPGACRLKRGWILGPGQELGFPSDEMIITLDNQSTSFGAWK